jgi:hypothetical protein
MRHTAREMIRKRFEFLKLNQKPEYSRQTKYTSFEEGDQILLWDDNVPKGIARKLHPRWLGPFMVLQRVSAYVYEILYKGKKKMVHARRLIGYHQYLLPDWDTPKPKKLADAPQATSDFKIQTDLDLDAIAAEKSPMPLDIKEHAKQGADGKSTDHHIEQLWDDGSRDKLLDLNPYVTPTQSDEKERDIQLDKFYLVKQSKELLLAKMVSINPTTVHWYRSLTEAREKGAPRRIFVPVWWDKEKDREDWSEISERTVSEFEELTTQISPKRIISVTGFLLKKGKIPKSVISQAENWLETHKRYFQKIGGRSWAPLKAKIGHKGTLLQTDKQIRKGIEKKLKTRISVQEKTKQPKKSKLGKRKIKWGLQPPRRSKRLKKASILKISDTPKTNYVYLTRIRKTAKSMNTHRMMKYQSVVVYDAQ